MVFNSLAFFIFFAVVFFLFYYLNGFARKILLFIASSFFYMWFIPQYIIILYFTIAVDFFIAMRIEASPDPVKKKRLLIYGILNTCIILFVFKYFNFFISNLNMLGFKQLKHVDIILPIGLSFHVFQSLSYLADVYRGKLKAERNLLVYSNFVMMFPQLVAGPIERAGNLLPQLSKCDHKISYADFSIGSTRFFLGLYKKVVIADNIGLYVDTIFANYMFHSGSSILVAALLFAIQIYCDFSGYSDMAIGIARMLGFRFKENFTYPYFSKSITEFWKRWHISLSSWLRDYIYIPLGGNRHGKAQTYKNIMLTMLIGGLWHGASWNFVFWGGLNGIYLVAEKMFKFPITNPRNILIKALRCGYVFILISFTWLFFRAANFQQAIDMLAAIFTNCSFARLNILVPGLFVSFGLALILLLLLEWLLLSRYSFDMIFSFKRGDLYLSALTVFLLLYIIACGASYSNQFIYFQF